MTTDIQNYCTYIAEVRGRLDVIQSFIDGKATTSLDACNGEFIFLQLRKILELIAFASLIANKDVYSAVHKRFDEHWRAKAMLAELEKVNPNFYPLTVGSPQEIAPGRKHFPLANHDFMTKDEFVTLYNSASELLHTRNPFTAKASGIEIIYPVQEWVLRIRRLIVWHVMHLVGGDKWVVNVPPSGDVQAWPASPID
jgi:hypothetical protein